jgi:hypothetical protein
VQSFPVLLQISLLLFGIALSANMWSQQHTIAWVIIATTVFGFMFYSLTVMAALVSPACPFQTPISTILRMMRVDSKLIFRVLVTHSRSKSSCRTSTPNSQISLPECSEVDHMGAW